MGGGKKKKKKSQVSKVGFPFLLRNLVNPRACLWGWKLPAEQNAALPFPFSCKGNFYSGFAARCLWDSTRFSRLFVFSKPEINSGFGDGMRGRGGRGKEPVLPSFCSLGKSRCVEALPVPRPVVKTFYEQTMSVYWNHMITEMGSFIVFRLKSVCSPSPSPGSPRPGLAPISTGMLPPPPAANLLLPGLEPPKTTPK